MGKVVALDVLFYALAAAAAIGGIAWVGYVVGRERRNRGGKRPPSHW